jgi:putative addiction module component (TIGR02574 family)
MTPETREIFALSPAEKLELVEDLWDDLARQPDDVPVHPWQVEVIEQRKVELEKAPESAVSWDDMTGRLRSLRRGD